MNPKSDLSIPASRLFTREDGTKRLDMTVTVRLTGLRRFRARVWIATNLIRLAGVVLGCGIDVHVETGEGKRW